MSRYTESAVMKAAERALVAVTQLERLGSTRAFYPEGPILRTLEEFTEVDRLRLEQGLKEFGEIAFRTRIAPWVKSLLEKRNY